MSKKGIFVAQRKCVLDLLTEIGKLGGKVCSAPMLPNFQLTTTSFDIAYSVSNVSQFMSSSTVCHWVALENILCYPKGTP